MSHGRIMPIGSYDSAVSDSDENGGGHKLAVAWAPL
jgi:hypothetical protein